MRLGLTPKRKMINLLIDNEQSLDVIPGIRRIEKGIVGRNCVEYVFGGWIPWLRLRGDDPDFPITTSPKPGDYVVYFNEDVAEHIGFYEKEKKCRSKWGSNDIYLHDLDAVPIQYGDRIIFLKNSKKLE